ncbi:hypothetical protein ALI22I_40650 [Saccharothrix sp. ALI-22-I]|uniref:DUF6069 family protein n=1 Tax=Saccharothrix sp. ALI-22-I TaxID=1933778 RepID=UPI00097BFB7A|nr:DUF6069 family protein [Saccharothrix sp. ALI-22-I]ONI82408.1 hypothetical protein ALI22I_40650 [Saccharothrix sp. ALI-22-I]
MPAGFVARGVLAAVVAALATLVVFLVARAGGVSFTLGLPGIDSLGGLTWYLVVAAAAALVATAYAAALRRVVPHNSARVFGWSVVVGAVLSCVPLLVLGLAAATTVALVAMHLVAGAVVLAIVLPDGFQAGR